MSTTAAVAAAVAAAATLVTMVLRWSFGRKAVQRQIDRKTKALKELHDETKKAYANSDKDTIAHLVERRNRLCKEISHLRTRLRKNN